MKNQDQKNQQGRASQTDRSVGSSSKNSSLDQSRQQAPARDVGTGVGSRSTSAPSTTKSSSITSDSDFNNRDRSSSYQQDRKGGMKTDAQQGARKSSQIERDEDLDVDSLDQTRDKDQY